ncbi:MAG: fluoride efflux transporter CrcB [Verrucomicrobia bacterium]|nr:fluoride efflux transporter CrcB [Verrucomicrobiota bacterium]
MWNILIIGAGSALGGMGRLLCSSFIAERFGETFPWGTIVVNVIGSFIIGLIAAMNEPESRFLMSPSTREFLMTGICGGFTTFSSFSLQTLNLMRAGELLPAVGNVTGSFVLCLLGVFLGYYTGFHLNRI